MKYFNKIKKKNLIITILLIAEVFSLILTYKSFNNKKVELSNNLESENRNFSMYMQDDDGEYYLSDKHYFPDGDNYVFNSALSSCIDARGDVVTTDYSFLNGKVTVTSNKTVYCTFYFDIVRRLVNELKLSNLVKEYRGTGYYHSESDKDTENPYFTQPIYYYYAENENDGQEILEKWNVVFGGYCWQMFRTTETGGVKLLYNGVPTITTDSETGKKSYYCGYDNRANASANFYTSGNEMIYSYSFGTSYDANGITGDITIVSYDHNMDYSSLIGKFTCLSISTKCSSPYYVTNAFNEKENSQVDLWLIRVNNSSAPSVNSIASPDYTRYRNVTQHANSGAYYWTDDNFYMYNQDLRIYPTTYDTIAKSRNLYTTNQISSSVSAVSLSNLSTSIYVGTSYNYSNNAYSLSGTITRRSSLYSDNYLVGKYTCQSTSSTGTCSSLSYIVKVFLGSGKSYYYTVTASDGTDPAEKMQRYTYGTSIIDNNDGTYSLSGNIYTNVREDNMPSYDETTAYYMCSDKSSTTCTDYYMLKFMGIDIGNKAMKGYKVASNASYPKFFKTCSVTDNNDGTYVINSCSQSYYSLIGANNFSNRKIAAGSYICLINEEDNSNTCEESNLYHLSKDINYDGVIEGYNGTRIYKLSPSISYDSNTGKYNLDMNDPKAITLKYGDDLPDKFDESLPYYFCFDVVLNYSGDYSNSYYFASNKTTCEAAGLLLNYTTSTSSYNSYIVLTDGLYVDTNESSQNFANEKNLIYAMFHMNNDSSGVKSFVDLWYYTNLLEKYDGYIDYDEIYCGDRTVIKYGFDKTTLGDSPPSNFSLGRLRTKSADGEWNLSCHDKLSAYSANETTYGNGDLTYPIALITTSEALNMGNSNSMRNVYSRSYFSMNSRSGLTGSNTYFIVRCGVSGEGSCYNMGSDSADIRPVLALKSGVNYVSGDGSTNNPYIVEEGNLIVLNDSNYEISHQSAFQGETVTISTKNPLTSVETFKINGELKTGNTFTMPNMSVVVQVVSTVQDKWNITCGDSSILVPNIAKVGSKIQLTSDDYYVTSFSINGTPVSGNSFTMPNEDVVITNIEKHSKIVVESSTHDPISDPSGYTTYYENTFAGATSLDVSLTYQTYANQSCSHYSNIALSRLSGSSIETEKYCSNTKKTIDIRIQGNYIKLVWYNRESYSSYINVYGFKAIITPNYD